MVGITKNKWFWIAVVAVVAILLIGYINGWFSKKARPGMKIENRVSQAKTKNCRPLCDENLRMAMRNCENTYQAGGMQFVKCMDKAKRDYKMCLKYC